MLRIREIALIAWRGKVTRNMHCFVIERMHHDLINDMFYIQYSIVVREMKDVIPKQCDSVVGKFLVVFLYTTKFMISD